MTINISKFQEKIDKKFPNENIQVIEYQGAREYTKIQCMSCGKIYEYSAGGQILSGRKNHCCIYCYSLNKKREHFIENLNNKFKSDKLQLIGFVDRKKPCKIKCETCGTVYEYKRAEYAINCNLDTFCKKCFPRKKEQRDNRIQQFKEYLNNNKDKWILAQDISNLSTTQNYVSCKCVKCGRINNKTIADYMRGRKCLCECSTEKKTKSEFQEILGDEYSIISEYNNIYDKIKIRHNTCGFIYSTVARNIVKGNGKCPRCSCKESKGEKKILKFLDNKNIKYIREYRVNINNHLLRFDFYLPEFDTFIEYNGIQHYQPIDHFGGKDRFDIQRQYDEYKKNYAKEKLIVISYIDFDNIENILSEKLLSSTTTLNEVVAKQSAAK